MAGDTTSLSISTCLKSSESLNRLQYFSSFDREGYIYETNNNSGSNVSRTPVLKGFSTPLATPSDSPFCVAANSAGDHTAIDDEMQKTIPIGEHLNW